MRFLVPNPVTLVPDRMQPFYYQIGATVNHPSDCALTPCEVPYFFEETMVPQGYEVTVGAFHWNGETQSVGDGCPSNPGDTGGADLMVTCVSGSGDPAVNGAAVFRQEYKDLYIDGNDYGPAAVLLNTASMTSVPISSTWFTCPGCDHIDRFTEQLKLSGGELASVLYPGGSGTISLPCTAIATYCNGDNSVSGNTTMFSSGTPGMIGPHSGIILLHKN